MSPVTLFCLFAVVVAAAAQDATTVKPFFCNNDGDCGRHCDGRRGYCDEKDNMCHHCAPIEEKKCTSELDCLRSCRKDHHPFGICYHSNCRCSLFG